MNKDDRLKFKKLFGLGDELLGNALIISPFLSPKFFKAEVKAEQSFKGLIYTGARGIYENKKVTFINTGIGHTLVGDCVLAQDPEKISTIIFLGAVGALNGLKIADCVFVKQAFFDTQYYEKFGMKWEDNPGAYSFGADDRLVDLCAELLKKEKAEIRQIDVVSLNSIWEEDESKVLALKKKNIQAVDLECAIFYAAAKSKKIKALGLCFVSDLLLSKPYWSNLSAPEQEKLKKSIKFLVKTALALSVLA